MAWRGVVSMVKIDVCDGETLESVWTRDGARLSVIGTASILN